MTKWDVKFDCQTIWQGMLADIESAHTSIELEQFSFYGDRIGRRFLRAFEQKLKQGVRVRLICDAINSQPMYASRDFKKLERLGIELIKFNPVSLLHPARSLFRIHKKTLIIDAKIAWVGGASIKDKFVHFRDSQVRLEGDAVAAIRRSFELLWQNCSPDKNQLDLSAKNSDFQYLINYNGYQKKEIYEWLRDRLVHAKQRIYFTTSYFYPDRNFFQLMLDKAKEGVDVRMILRGKDDEFFPIRFSASFFEQALQNGIGLYRYGPKIMHAKTFIIDDEASIGSCNLDKFSFYYNLESNLVSRQPEFVQTVSRQFFKDLQVCSQIHLPNWKKRPLLEQALELLIWPIWIKNTGNNPKRIESKLPKFDPR